jgi:transposase
MEATDESRSIIADSAQFSKIAPHLPTDKRGKPRTDDWRVISGSIHALKEGGRWIDALSAPRCDPLSPANDTRRSLRIARFFVCC